MRNEPRIAPACRGFYTAVQVILAFLITIFQKNAILSLHAEGMDSSFGR